MIANNEMLSRPGFLPKLSGSRDFSFGAFE